MNILQAEKNRIKIKVNQICLMKPAYYDTGGFASYLELCISMGVRMKYDPIFFKLKIFLVFYP